MPTQQPRQAEDGPTLGEIGRLLEALRAETKDFRTEVNVRFDGLSDTYVRKDVFDAVMLARSEYVKGLEERLASLEGNQAWIVRIVVSTVVMALIGGLFAASRLVGA